MITGLSLSRLDKLNQFLEVVEIIIIAHNAFTVIYDAGFLIAFKAVQEFFHTVPACKFGKRTRLDLLCIKTFTTVRRLALIASANVLSNTALAHLTPFRVLAPGEFLKAVPFAAFANHVFGTQTTCQTTTCDTEFSFHNPLLINTDIIICYHHEAIFAQASSTIISPYHVDLIIDLIIYQESY